jgi:hypothetical protein
VYTLTLCEPGSSVGIVSGYGLDDRAIVFDLRQRRNYFSSSLSFQIGSGAHPASYTMGTIDPYSGTKGRQRRDADHSPHLVPRLWMSRSYTSSPPPSASMACSGTALSFYTLNFRLHTGQQAEGQKTLNQIVASLPLILSALNLFVHAISICYCCPQI